MKSWKSFWISFLVWQQIRNITIFLIVVTQKLVLQQPQNVTEKCTETLLPPALYSILLVLTIKSLMKHLPFSHTPQILSLSFIPLFSLSRFFSIFIFSLFHILSFSFFYLFYFFFLFFIFFSLLTLFFFLSFFSPSLSFSLFPPSPKKYIDQEPPYLMHQICVLIKKKEFRGNA